jgi:hypothetical protein
MMLACVSWARYLDLGGGRYELMPIDFIYALDGDVSPSIFFSKTDGVVTVDLGSNPATGLSYSLFCALAPCVVPTGAMEYSFWIADYDPDTNHSDRIWHGSDTKHLIQGDYRPFVLYLVCEGLRVLVDRFRPQCVFIQTMSPNLPDKALAKYYQLGQVLTESGYQFGRVDPYHGYEAWLAKRKEQ